jgi:hypothetical protein
MSVKVSSDTVNLPAVGRSKDRIAMPGREVRPAHTETKEARNVDWKPIKTAPHNRTLLLAAKPPSHLWWKFGIGSFETMLGPDKPILFDWGWAFQPTHWCALDAPDGGRTDVLPWPAETANT